MPHVVLEMTDNLGHVDPRRAMAAVNQALLDTAEFSGPDIKARVVLLDSYQVGDGRGSAGFIHATLEILSGRSLVVKRAMAAAVARALSGVAGARLPPGLNVQVTVDIRDLDRDVYAKSEIGTP